VNIRTNDGWTPAVFACWDDRLACLQLLVDAKADLSVKSNAGTDMLHYAMLLPYHQQAHRVPGMPFAVLSCNTDSKNVRITNEVTQAMVNSYINEYTQIHAFIDGCHNITKHTLSEDVVVDKRVGRRGNGIYHEPLEQVLLYLGLSMKKNQTVNTSIDSKTITRALLPGYLTNANLWFELYKRAHCSSCSTRLPKLSKKKCPCNTARYCNADCQRKHWQVHKADHKAVMQEKKKKKK
jgi:hypothetical protein